MLKVSAHTESITLSRASRVSASRLTWEQRCHCITVVRLLCFSVSLHQPPAVHQGWWTGCRCCWPWSWKEHPCSLHRPARTSGSPHCILTAGTPGRPEDHLREQIQFFYFFMGWRLNMFSTTKLIISLMDAGNGNICSHESPNKTIQILAFAVQQNFQVLNRFSIMPWEERHC